MMVVDALPIERYPHLLLLNRIWELLTTDARLAKAAPNVAELIQ